MWQSKSFYFYDSVDMVLFLRSGQTLTFYKECQNVCVQRPKIRRLKRVFEHRRLRLFQKSLSSFGLIEDASMHITEFWSAISSAEDSEAYS